MTPGGFLPSGVHRHILLTHHPGGKQHRRTTADEQPRIGCFHQRHRDVPCRNPGPAARHHLVAVGFLRVRVCLRVACVLCSINRLPQKTSAEPGKVRGFVARVGQILRKDGQNL